MRGLLKRLCKMVMILLGILLVLAGIGMIYQSKGAAEDRKFYHPSGKVYDVFGGKMHLYTEGEGDTTVVFASGWGTVNPYADFYPLYEGLKEYAKIAVYDRFGYGYSGMTDRPRDVDSITSEIHELLKVSGQNPPYVFAAHSLGALETLRYTQRYPDEVKGILMIEGGSPEYYESSPELNIVPVISKGLRKTGVFRALYHTDGFASWIADESNGEKLLPEELQETNRRALLLLSGNRNMADEIRWSHENARVVIAGGKPLPIPITVLTADYFGKQDQDQSWMKSQALFTSWSGSGKQLVVPESSHYIHSYKPELVNSELLQLIKK